MPHIPYSIHTRAALPCNIQMEDLAFFIPRLHAIFPEAHIKKFEFVRFNWNNKIFAKGRVYAESFADCLEEGRWNHQLGDFYKNKKTYLKFLANNYLRYKHQGHFEEAFVFTDNFSMGYFEWFGSALPRLMYAKEKGINAIALLPFCTKVPFIKESLELLNLRYEEVKPNAYVTIDQLLVPSRQTPLQHTHPLYFNKVRESLLYAICPQGLPQAHKRLYISRAKARCRRITNEDDLAPILEARGFLTITPEKLSIKETALLLSSATHLVSIHGAGLTNMIFMQPGTAVLECCNPQKSNLVYCKMAHALGLDYYYQFADKILEDSIDLNSKSMWIDPELFEKNLDLMLGKGS
jgi:capsular polysaccharide biosynthesis protein